MVDPDGFSGGLRVALLPVGFAVGAVLSRSLLAHPPAAYATDLAQPLAVVTYWQQFGLLMWIALAAAVMVASVGYVLALGGVRSLAATMLFSALTGAAALAFPVVFSSDVYAYAGYGWLSLHAVSPYAHASVTAHTPLLDAVVWQWGNPPPVCVYGPAFVWFSQFLVWAVQSMGPAAPLWAFRIAACAALVLCAPLAYAAFPERLRGAAAAGISLNPVAIWSCAEGHNDVYVLAIALGGFALMRRSREFAGALVVTLSALVKGPGLIAAGVAAMYQARDARFARAAYGFIAGMAICAILGWPALAQLMHGSTQTHYYFPQFSVQYVLASTFGDSAGIALSAALIAACAGLSALCALRRDANALMFFALALWIAIPNPYPWYALWILPLAFLRSGPTQWAIVCLTLFTALRYLPDATTDVPRPLSDLIALGPIAAAAATWAVAVRAGTRHARV